MNDCIFCKIARGEIPSTKLYEDDKMLIIKDINPQAKYHYLIIPKQHFEDIGELALKGGDLLTYCIKIFAAMADTLGLGNGYRLITNKGSDGRQSVSHIHIHILGGERLTEKMG